jgi:4-hydroxythreonine-4-phosphate dehydrogenase
VGIGPEVVAKALSRPEIRSSTRTVVIGSVPVLERALALVDSELTAHRVDDPRAAVADGEIAVIERNAHPGIVELAYGHATAQAGAAAVDWAMTAARLAMDGAVAGIATAPLNKEAANLAGHSEVGHQEIYQAMTGATQVVTMLVTPGLRVVHLTTHRSLRIACDHVTKDNVLSKLELMHEFFSSHGFASPRLAAAALNPHAGEAGIIGSEEIEAIAPAVEAARALGIDATGPVPADSVFNQAIDGRFDAVLAMYHDQGHIAIKVHDWAASVTMNLGLPFLRTSVDHGTAFDIAGRGIADDTGMVQAIRLASSVAETGTLAGF